VTFYHHTHFQQLYKLCKMFDFDSFYESLSPKFNKDQIFKAGEGAGRSGSFFFHSHDSKYVVKTVTSDELEILKGMTPAMTQYLFHNQDSLLSRVLGIFTIKASKFSEVHIMLMENTMRLKDKDELKFVFDLKGSTVDRFVMGKYASSVTLKDVNFI
jgi:hypothetical protein